MMKVRPGELLVPALVGAFAVAYLVSVQGLPRESTVFPYTLLITMAILGGFVLRREAGGKATAAIEGHKDLRGEFARPALILVGSIVYLALFAYTGFLLAGVVFMVATMVILRIRVWKAVLVSVLFVSAMYLLFSKVFYVDL